MITGKTAIYGIFGFPVEHTFSPAMHNAAFVRTGLDACYVPFAVRPERLGDAFRAIVPLGLRGLNITVPHKERVIPFLDDVAEDAKLIGAVNTVQVRDGKLIGHNTDGRGFIRSLRQETSVRPRGASVLIIGAGGAARAVGFNLAREGAREIFFHDSDAAKAGGLAEDISARTGCATAAVDAGDLSRAASAVSIVINATPLGLKPKDPLPLPKDALRGSHLVCDLVYNPPATALLKAARAKGAVTLPGLGMLLYQGVLAFELWTGRKAPVEIMKTALRKQIGKGKK